MKMTRRTKKVCIMALLLLGSTLTAASVIYVDASASGANNGTSWADAYGEMQDALDEAASGDQIWVAAGTYNPTRQVGGTGDRYRAFQLKNGVEILGGFTGTETSAEQRDWDQHSSILSGDIGVVDDPADNCYHVFYHPRNSDLDNTAVLDGFTITGGNADYPISSCRSGGGFYNYDASPTIRNCTFTDNAAGGSAYSHGGAMFNTYSSPQIINCYFTQNVAESFGGAISNIDPSSPTIRDCVFEENRADSTLSRGRGGAVYNGSNSSPRIVNCLFEKNSAKLDGGAVCNEGLSSYPCSPKFIGCVFNNNQSDTQHGGAVFNSTVVDTLFVNCIISNNTAGATGRHGGAMYNHDSSPRIINCVFYNNQAGCVGDGIYNYQFSDAEITNSVLWNVDGSDVIMNINNSNPVVTYCVVQGGYGTPADQNSDENPGFIDAQNGDFRVSSGSPCIDAGDNTAVPADIADLDADGDTAETLPYDIAFKARIFDYQCAAPAVVDIGAYERTSAEYGDLDGDCRVNLYDFSILSGGWQSGNNRADIQTGLAGPCLVDMDDLLILINNWLEGI